ncbi:hypothetical protein VCR17J2_640094 [Vibrio coralliirubri]|nr:hypothetical protein VCR17J2_640094 [Vibrio coralliirubri]
MQKFRKEQQNCTGEDTPDGKIFRSIDLVRTNNKGRARLPHIT